MQTLSQIKDLIAQRNGYADWLQIDMTEKEESERNQEKVDMMDEIAVEFAKAACEEQAYICYETYDSAQGTPDEIGGAILNAPLPDLK